MTINEQIQNGATSIVLTEDVSENVVIPVGFTITIDLAGFTLSNDKVSGNEYTITNSGTLQIIDSVGTGAVYNDAPLKGCLVNLKGGTVAIEGGTFRLNEPRPNEESWYHIVNLGTLMEIDEISINSSSDFTTAVRNGFYTDAEKEQNYIEGVYPRMVINGGSIKSLKIPVKNDEGGDLVVNDGYFESANEAILNWNVARIEGGEFKVPEDKFVIFSGAYTTDIAEGKMEIKGGEFIGGKGIRDLTKEYAPEKEDSAYTYVEGGAWKVDDTESVTSFVKPGYEFEVDGDGNIVVSKTPQWDYPEGGRAGMGMIGQFRVYAHIDSILYKEGGFTVPIRGFTPSIVLAMSRDGCDGYYNRDTKKIQLFRSGIEVTGRIHDLTLLMFGQ